MLKKIHIRNFKAIGDEGVTLDNLAPINYLIGPNGSGKSSVLESISCAYMTSLPKDTIDQLKLSEVKQMLLASLDLSPRSNIIHPQEYRNGIVEINDSTFILEVYKKGTQSELILPGKDILKLIKLINLEINNSNSSLNQDNKYLTGKNLIKMLKRREISYLKNFSNTYYTRNRSIKFNYLNLNKSIQSNLFFGNLMPDIKNKIPYEKIISEIETNLKINFTRHHSILDSLILHYYQFDSAGENTLQILLNFIVIVLCDHIQENLIVSIEEPEINLHPEWQKLLIKFFNLKSIFEIICKQNIKFLISTHSPFIINSALELDRENLERFKKLKDKGKIDEEAKELGNLSDEKGNFKPTHKVYHLENGENVNSNGEGITANQFSVGGIDNIFGSIGVQPSDLLFANGVIWVEGHTDAIVYDSLFQLFQEKTSKKETFKQGTNYTFQVLATALWKYAGFWDISYTQELNDEQINDCVNILNISRKNLLIIDKDYNYDKHLPDCFQTFRHGTGRNKARLIYKSIGKDRYKEISELNLTWDGEYTEEGKTKLAFWVNQNTLETYFKYFDKSQFNEIFDPVPNSSIYSKIGTKDGLSSDQKNKFARKVFTATKDEDKKDSLWKFIKNTDLINKFEALYHTITSWNTPN
jgi:AAA15 family ATPase/GTPase